jgi:hypothetical protein
MKDQFAVVWIENVAMVGWFKPDGKWHNCSDHLEAETAIEEARVLRIQFGKPSHTTPELIEAFLNDA